MDILAVIAVILCCVGGAVVVFSDKKSKDK